MEQLVNEPDAVVDEMLDGLVKANPDALRRPEDTDVVVRDDAPVEGKVSVITGGGSGHEPMHAGYIGSGMLDGAAAGAIFTSPSATEFRRLIDEVDEGAGILAVIKNYEGDIMNFETATDLTPNADVEMVVVDDDVAVSEETGKTGRRGVAGTIFVHKVAGAKAAQGGSLEEVKAVAEKAVDNVASMGVALSSCTPPEKGSPTFELGEEEVELGIGIHGEPGIEQTKLDSADAVTERLTEKVIEDLDLGDGDEVAAMVNGLGNTPLSELYVVNRKLHELLDEVGVRVANNYVGEYCTSLDMRGCSITLLDLNDELAELLAEPAATPEFTVEND